MRPVVAVEHAERSGRATGLHLAPEVVEGTGRLAAAQDHGVAEDVARRRREHPVRPGAQDAAVARTLHVEEKAGAVAGQGESLLF